MPPDQKTLGQLSLSREEYDRIVDLLDREPNEVELGMFGAMWSEHCGYKNSRPLLKMFPSEGAGVLTKVGEENAGVIDIGDGFCVAFKIESHNHPSAIEPYEGAATGVGGIVRDIFAMGARPVALLDSLRFGPLQPTNPPEPQPGVPMQAYLPETTPEQAARNRYLFNGVVAGIGGYGNCIGIPTVGGETSFAPCYNGNPLVNAMCVGIAKIDKLVKARADGPGNLLLLVGADTGRDGIHGATFASVQLDESSEERRPAVQVGNPFLEKLLMEACLELTEEHHEWIVGLQDLGAAGLTSSTVESAAKAGTGLIIDVAKVPRREDGMTPYEVMLSESQERMLVIVKPEHEANVRGVFERWELHCATIGIVTDDGVVRIHDNGVEVGAIPAKMLTDAPTYVRDVVKPAWLTDLQDQDNSSKPDLIRRAGFENHGVEGWVFNEQQRAPGWPPLNPNDARGSNPDVSNVLLSLLRSPEIASKRLIWRQYDHQVGTNTVVGPGSDAAVIRIKGTKKALAIATDGNAAYTYLDPYMGGAIAVAEAARNVVCTGARPIGMTNCLNFGNPEKPDGYFQLHEAIRGMSDAAKALGIPVISGNVSLYNETNGEAIWPTPVVGVVGLIDDVDSVVPMGFPTPDLKILLVYGLAEDEGYIYEAALAGSQYSLQTDGLVRGKPELSLRRERNLQSFLLEASSRGLVTSAHDIGPGGLAVAIVEACLAHGVGAHAAIQGARDDINFFGEEQSFVVISCERGHLPGLRDLAERHHVDWEELGVTGRSEITIEPHYVTMHVSLEEAREAYETGLARALEGVAANA